MNCNFKIIVAIASVALLSCNSTSTETNSVMDSTGATAMTDQSKEVKIKEEPITYRDDTVTLKGFIAYNENVMGKRPAILVVPEWWGLGNYERTRIKQLAELGYIAMAVDVYGNGRQADNPKDAMTLVTAFYNNPTRIKTRIDAALAAIKKYAQSDSLNIAAIGYCFGGGVALNAAKLGADLKGVVSFHGNLSGVAPDKNLLKAHILICHGESDNFVPQKEIAAFKKSMDSINANYTFKTYPNATHAFTNPEATGKGKKFNMPIAYNAAADSASWNDMKEFFKKIF